MAKRFDAPDPNSDEAAAWEERLKKEGLAAELPPDKAAEKLRKEAGVEADDLADKIHKKLQEYWQFRGASWYGNHQQAAQDVAADLGINPDDVDIDQAYVLEIEREITDAQRALVEAANKLAEKGPIMPKTKMNILRRQAYKDFPNISESVLDDITAKLSGEGDWGELRIHRKNEGD